MKYLLFTLLFVWGVMNLSAQPSGGPSGGSSTSGVSSPYTFKKAINGLWQYNSSADVYYIVGIQYCSSPASSSYEQMGIFVPAKYMDATSNSDGTYTCTINTGNTVNGYSAQSAPSGYSSDAATYTAKGFIYLWAGCRGRDAGAPLGVTDLKAAIRYYRYLQAEQNAVPGNVNCIFSFGHSGGGAQSSLLGASGNSSLYNDYLNAIGAVTGYKDNVLGSQCWCPITNLDQADAAYEWNMGQTRSGLSSADQSISKGLTSEYADYINAIGLKDPSTGKKLTLESTSDGYYQGGSYYQYIMAVINDAVTRYNKYNSASVSTYSTTDASALNSFSSTYKNASKGLGAFDDYDTKGQAENTLMGVAGTAGHFDKYLAPLINTYASSYYSSFISDLSSNNVDAVGKTVDYRLMMYTPLYYLIDNSTYYSGGGSGSSDVASYWRIRTGIDQGDTSLGTETNLALALQNYNGVKSVDFETIWGLGHTEAEDTGTASDNFISWVENCMNTYTTGIETVSSSSDTNATISSIYSINGTQLQTMQQGINIVKYGNGTVKKIILKLLLSDKTKNSK